MKHILFAFFAGVFTLNAAADMVTARWQPAENCRANIAAVTCFVEPYKEGDDFFNRACKPGAEIYVTELEKVHDEMPEKMQKIFCGLRKIFVEDHFRATASASTYYEVVTEQDGKRYYAANGLVLSLSKEKIFDSEMSLTDWANHKEQTAFGRAFEDDVPADFPRMIIDYHGFNAKPLLLDTVIHEFGHFMDFTHSFNRQDISKCMDTNGQYIPGCEPPFTGVWNSMSWNMNGTYREEDTVFNGLVPCYYGCDANRLHDITKATELYRNFVGKKAFVTPYAANNPYDDLAETFLFYTIHNKYSGKVFWSYWFADQPDKTVSLLDNVFAGRNASKMEFMQLFHSVDWKITVPPERWPIPDAQAPNATPSVFLPRACAR